MANNSKSVKVRQLVNELEAHLDLGFIMPPFGRFVKAKEIEPILKQLKELAQEMESEENIKAEVITEN